MKESYRRPNRLLWIGVRLLPLVAVLLCGGLILAVDQPGAAEANLMNYGFMMVLPLCLGVAVSLALDPKGSKPWEAYLRNAAGVTAVLVVGGGILLREGLICIVLLSPIWLLFSSAGGYLVYRLHALFTERFRLNCSLLALCPILVLFVEPQAHRADQFVVARSVQIEASPAEVWPLLLGLDSISVSEGKWNITQDVLGVPRPLAAQVVGDGVGARRLASWSSDISFEEHIVSMVPGRELAWRFVFPNDSIQHRIDRHIEPDGRYLKIDTGSYELEELKPGVSELRLRTAYTVRTPVNHYGAVWGELMLGDIQSNILHVIKQRAERD